MQINNKGVSPLFLVLSVVLLISIVFGGYYFYTFQQRKENISKIEKLDSELFDLIDSENYFTMVGGEATPKTQSSINSHIEKIEDNLDEYEKTLKLVVNDNSEIFCITDRNSSVEVKFVDSARRSLLGSGSSQFTRNFYAKNFEDDVTDWKAQFRRGCKSVYQENGIELND